MWPLQKTIKVGQTFVILSSAMKLSWHYLHGMSTLTVFLFKLYWTNSKWPIETRWYPSVRAIYHLYNGYLIMWRMYIPFADNMLWDFLLESSLFYNTKHRTKITIIGMIMQWIIFTFCDWLSIKPVICISYPWQVIKWCKGLAIFCHSLSGISIKKSQNDVCACVGASMCVFVCLNFEILLFPKKKGSRNKRWK